MCSNYVWPVEGSVTQFLLGFRKRNFFFLFYFIFYIKWMCTYYHYN